MCREPEHVMVNVSPCVVKVAWDVDLAVVVTARCRVCSVIRKVRRRNLGSKKAGAVWMLLLIEDRMKEFLCAAVVCGIIAYFLCQPSTTPQLERAERRRATENGPISNKSSTPKAEDGSLGNRWQTTSTFQK
jgi:hypothetical protein